MKNFTSLSVILVFCSINTYASEFTFIADDNKITTKICVAAATNNTDVMVSKIRMLSRRGTTLNFTSFVNTLMCNNQYIGNFAKKYDAYDTFEYLDRYTNRRNKNRQSNISIRDYSKVPEKNSEKGIVVLVTSH